MRLLLGNSSILVGLGLLVGCSDTPPPIKEAAKVGGETEAPKLAVLAPRQRPERSDPIAAAIIEAAIKAHTGGKPEALQAFKSLKVSREGQGVVMTAEPVLQKWQLQMVWPDRIRYRLEMPQQQIGTLVRAGDIAWASGSGAPGKQIMPIEQTAAFNLDTSWEWLWLLFPLTEPTTVFATDADAAPNSKPASGVRVWAKGITDAVLYFDKETKLLSQITFDGREGIQKVTKEVVVYGTKAFSGATLPEKMVLRSNGKYLCEWTVTGFEPTVIDSKVFENP